MKNNNAESNTSIDAIKIAKATQKPGQTKQQTKLITQGIEKGIAAYKKQQKAKSRERDKNRKAQLKQKIATVQVDVLDKESEGHTKYVVSLILSWLFFLSYIIFDKVLS